MIFKSLIRELYPLMLLSLVLVGLAQWENTIKINSFSATASQVNDSISLKGECGDIQNLRLHNCGVSLIASKVNVFE